MHPIVSDPDLRGFLLSSIDHARSMADRTEGPAHVSVLADGGISVTRRAASGAVASMIVTPWLGGHELMDKLMQFTLVLGALPTPIVNFDELDQNERTLAEAGNVIGAIKAHRERSGYGLRASKDVVDAYRLSLPSDHPVKVAFEKAQAEARARGWG